MDEKIRALIFTGIGHYLNDTFLVLLSILIVYYLVEGISPVFLAIASAVYGVISGLLSAPIGGLADRKQNYAELMFFGFFLIGMSNILFAVSFLVYKLYFIAVGSVMLGSGAAFYHPLGGSILQIKYGGKEAPKALGINGSLGSLGRAISPTLLVLLLTFLGKVRGMLVVSIYTFVLGIIVYLGLRGLTIIVSGDKTKAVKSSIRKYTYLLLPLSIMIFVRSMFTFGVMMYIPSYMTYLYKSTIVMGLVLTVSYSMAIFGQPYFGRITSSLGGRMVLIITTVGATVSFLLFILLKGFYVQTILFAIYSFFAYSGFPNLLGYVGQVVDRGALTRANGIVWGIGNSVGGAIGVLLGGSLIASIGLGAVMWVFAAIAVASTALLAILPKQRGA
ncbi:MAG: MFS transporter [Conexivisphaerales archaeon]